MGVIYTPYQDLVTTVTGDGVGDHYAILQAAITAANEPWAGGGASWMTNNTRVLQLVGDFNISQGLTSTGGLILDCNCTITATSGFTVGGTMLTITGDPSIGRTYQTGMLNLDGLGIARMGIQGNLWGRSNFERVAVRRCLGWGFKGDTGGSNNFIELNITGQDCGESSTTAYSEDSNVGSTGSVTQRSTLTCAVPEDTIIVVEGSTRYYVTTWIDATHIEVFPRVSAGGSGTFTYYSGGALGIGTDAGSNVWLVKHEAIQCDGMAAYVSCLYGPHFLKYSSTSCGIGCVIGGGPGTSMINSLFEMPYSESNTEADWIVTAANNAVTLIEPMDAGGGDYGHLLFADNQSLLTIMRKGDLISQNYEHTNLNSYLPINNTQPSKLFTNTTDAASGGVRLPVSPMPGASIFTFRLKGYDVASFVIDSSLVVAAGYTIEGVAGDYTILPNAKDRKIEVVLFGTDYRVFEYEEKVTEETVTTAAPALSTVGTTIIDSTSNAVDATLADGAVIGDEKIITMSNASNSSTVSVTNHETSAPEVFTFNATTAHLKLVWLGTYWATVIATATV